MKKSQSAASLGRTGPALSDSQFTLESQIGTGSFGTVFKAIHKPSQTPCAIKRIDLESSDDEIEEIQKEIAILSECNNHFITRYYGCFMREFELSIVMEYLGAGSCLDLIKDLRPNTLPESVIAEIMNQVVQGLAYLHQSGKIHRDIKAANVLISETGEVKIADFGVAAQLSNHMSRRNTFVGTPFWMAPEVINEQDYSYNADIWSLGITAMELAYGRPPWSHLHPMKALFTIPRSDPPRLDQKFSPEFQDFVATCLQMEPRNRGLITSLAKHPFLERRNRQELMKLLPQRVPPKLASLELGSRTIGSRTLGSRTVDSALSTPVSSPERPGLASQSPLSSSSLKPNTASRSSTLDSQQTLQNDDDWDFDTIKPQPSLEEILQDQAAPDTAETPTEASASAHATMPAQATMPADFVLDTGLDAPIDMPLAPTDAVIDEYPSVSTTRTHNDHAALSGVSLVRVFHHAARKFKDPVLEDISDLLRADPPTAGVENYLVRRISKLATHVEPKHSRDPIEQILLDKWLSEVREAHER